MDDVIQKHYQLMVMKLNVDFVNFACFYEVYDSKPLAIRQLIKTKE